MEEKYHVISTNSISNSNSDKLGDNSLTNIESPFK